MTKLLKEEWPKNIDELIAYFQELKEYSRDYNTSAEAVAYGTVAAFNYLAADEHGLTGFQASWSAMKALSIIRNIDGAFTIVSTDALKFNTIEDELARVKKFLHDSIKKQEENNNE
ncbi:hypothetical protein CPT_Moonbeam199 [Bacillus phage Moonbeam]|uniref:Uncharacterized protein n=1 Tax=Bacillus phage Moonbeam TaxID=1540091 RepID=A0A0A0RNK5_9CAUD|nr:hypothetical protein CPT_Moonbeam199 [Bacillus phage Moonbeam]AIW03597.1 hypothetical protein CPT_Moonbeam199 [Bacillus phage Moonbeam]